MKFLKFIFILIINTQFVYSQSNTEQTQTTHDALNGFGSLLGMNKVGAASEIKGPEGILIGTPFIDSNFHKATIKFYKAFGNAGNLMDSLTAVPIRYDLYNNAFEVMVNGYNDIGRLEGNLVRYFLFNNRIDKSSIKFINIKDFESAEDLKGFMEELVVGKVSFLEKTKLSILKPNFNIALNIGTKDTKIIKSQIYYFVKDNKIEKLPNSKKKILELFIDKERELNSWLKANEIDFRQKSNLKLFFEYYNSL